MTLDGNLVQIPNASVYKSNLRNFTINSNRRADFVVGIGYDDAVSEVQEIVQKVLEDHPAVLKELNGREHSWLKVRSSVIGERRDLCIRTETSS